MMMMMNCNTSREVTGTVRTLLPTATDIVKNGSSTLLMSDTMTTGYTKTTSTIATTTTSSNSSMSSSYSLQMPQLQQAMIISRAEEMNPTRRSTMEDRCVIHMPGEWNAPDPNMTYVGIYDGHGGTFWYTYIFLVYLGYRRTLVVAILRIYIYI
jgi:hypothetical protein